LADGAERGDLLAWVQERPTHIIKLADPRNFFMVVKNFGGEEMDFAREQQAHNQGAHPEFSPIFPPASQWGFALTLSGLEFS